MERKNKENYRFVLRVGGELIYYSGSVVEEDSQYITIDEIRLGRIQLPKYNLVTRRAL